MSNQPYGPHGPSYDGPPQTTPNPTVPTPVPNTTYAPVGLPAASDPYPGSSSGGYSLGGLAPGEAAQILAATGAKNDFLVNLIVAGILSPVWVCLYPLSAAAGFFTLLYGAGLAIRFIPPSAPLSPNLIASAIALVAALIVLWNVSRLEHVLARFSAYRIPRHVVRLVLLAAATVLAIERFQGIPISYPALQSNFTRVLSNPVNLAIVAGVMVASHFILWNWKWAREAWHQRLVGAGLRARTV